MSSLSETDLILNTDGSIYHLNLLPGDIAEIIITVANTELVTVISSYFDSIELKKEKGEFCTHTGYILSKRVTVISTGTGTNNIDIILNELDALVNIDFNLRSEKKEKKTLTIMRISTAGSLQENIPIDSLIVSEYAIGLDTLMHYYNQSLSLEEEHFKRSIENYFEGLFNIPPYVAGADKNLLTTMGKNLKHGITITTPGFYAPQSRMIRARGYNDNLIKSFQNFTYNKQPIATMDMETAGFYALSNILGHKAIAINAITHNRANFQLSVNPEKVFNEAIALTLKSITES